MEINVVPTRCGQPHGLSLNSCVCCLLGSLPSLISILRIADVGNFLLYVKSRQGQSLRVCQSHATQAAIRACDTVGRGRQAPESRLRGLRAPLTDRP